MARWTLPGRSVGQGMFAALGRSIVRRPWVPVIVWIALLVIALPFLPRIGDVTSNSTTTLPSNAPSQVAAAEIARLFPGQIAASSSLLLFLGSNVTNASSQSAIIGVTHAIENDSALSYVASVDSVYTSYQQYLDGLAQITLGTIAGAEAGAPPLSQGINQSAMLLWSPAAIYLETWEGIRATDPSAPPSSANYPAYATTLALLPNSSAFPLVLSTFYNGANANGEGFNGTANCAAAVNVSLCTDLTNQAQVSAIIPMLAPTPEDAKVGNAVLDQLVVANYTDPVAQRGVGATILGPEAGVPVSFVDLVWSAFPAGQGSPGAVTQWTTGIVLNGTLWTYPLPVPVSIRSSFVNETGGASLVIVTFTKDDSYVGPNGTTPIYENVNRINALVPGVLAQTGTSDTLTFYQTGEAPLDQFESNDLNLILGTVLPLTVGVLFLITLLYFRSPITPLATFASIGIAVALSLGGAFLLGSLVTKFDPTTLTLANTFVLGVGTDYSVFLVARYREELFKGADPKEAVITSVTWAGQSVATSGTTAVIATLALTFSGLALLSQWGMVLSLAILITVLVSLTLTPALLVLIGPKIFWPMAGARFDRMARRTVDRRAEERTYFFRAGRLTQRRPWAFTLIIVAVSIPLIYVALNVPLSYDFYGQLPNTNPSTQGLQELGNAFGPGFAFPMQVLVGFHSPFLVGNQTNASQFTLLGEMSTTIATTSGVASLASPIGPMGAPLASWVTYSTQSPGTQAQLRGILAQYLGNDGKTVLLTVTSAYPGLSLASVNLLSTLKSTLGSFQAQHPEVASLAFGGGASVSYDLAQQTSEATERLALFVSIGLIVVLLVVLRSWAIPLMAVATIGLSIAWAWAITYLVFDLALGYSIFYFVPTIMFLLILGLGIDYNIFLLTRVREERLRGRVASESVVHAVASTGGIITAAAIILASAFGVLTTGNFVLLKAIGFAVATAVLLDAMIVRTYLVPSLLQLLGERAWSGFGRRKSPAPAPAAAPAAVEPTPPSPS